MSSTRKRAHVLVLPLLVGLVGLIGVGCSEQPPAPPTACPTGTYSVTGTTPCTPAPPGFYVDTVGATSATACPLGRFQNVAGSVACQLAPLGFYVDVVGAAAATACPPGSTTLSLGATSPSDCVVPQ